MPNEAEKQAAVPPPSSSEKQTAAPAAPVPAAPPAATEADSERTTLQEEARLWRERAQNAERDALLRRALAGVDWFDVEDAYRDLAGRAEPAQDGSWRVVLPAAPGAPPPPGPAHPTTDIATHSPPAQSPRTRMDSNLSITIVS